MEGLGSAARTAPPLVFGSAPLRRARILSERAVTWPSKTEALLGFGFFVPPRMLCAGRRTLPVLLNAGSVLRDEAASNRCDLALAASEAGRTACTDVAKAFGSLAGPSVLVAALDVRAFESRPLKAR